MSSKYEVPTTPCRNLFKLNLLGCWFTSKVLLKFALIFQLCNKRQQSLLQFALIFWQLVSELLEQRPGIPWLWSSMQLVKSSSGLEKSFRSAIMAFIYWFICLFLLLWCPGGDKEDGMEWNGDASWGCRRCSSVRYTVAGGPMKPTAQYLWVVPGCLISCSHSQK